MITTFLLALAVLLAVVLLMSVGVMVGRKPITGSCGGIQNLGINATCEFCGGDPEKCESRQSDVAEVGERADRTEALYYAADGTHREGKR